MKQIPQLVALEASMTPEPINPTYEKLSATLDILPHKLGTYAGTVANSLVKSLLFPIMRKHAIDDYTNNYMRAQGNFIDPKMSDSNPNESGLLTLFSDMANHIWKKTLYYLELFVTFCGVAYLVLEVCKLNRRVPNLLKFCL